MRRLSGAAALAMLLVAGASAADPLSDLEKAHSAYVAHKYGDAESRLRALLDEKTGTLKDPDNVADARMYLGAVLVEEGRKIEADEVFEKLLLDKPDYKYDPLMVSTEAINAFLDAQARLRETIRNRQDTMAREEQAKKAKAELERERATMRVAMLEKLASEETVVEHHSRWIAILPFGVGQFQNGAKDLGWVFLSTEGLLAVGSAVSASVTYYEAIQSSDATSQGDFSAARAYSGNAYKAFIAANLFTGGLFVTAIVGAIQAELTFVPEVVTVRSRPLPPIALAPLIGPGGLGLQGRF